MTTAETILAAHEPAMQLEEIQIPEWGASVWLGGWSALERDAIEPLWKESREKPGFRARVLVQLLKDESGQRIFRDEQADALGAKWDAVIDRLFDRAIALSGLTHKDAEDAAKNSGSGPSAAS